MKFTTVAGLSSTGDSSRRSCSMRRASANAATSVAALSAPDAGNLFQLVHRRQRQRIQRAEFLQNVLPHLHHVRALQSGAQQDGDQLRVRQRIRPARHEPFARTLARRLVFEAETFGHEKFVSKPAAKHTRKMSP